MIDKHQEDLQRLKNLRLLDDDFMTRCFENEPACAELVLHIVLGNPGLEVKSVQTQYTMKNLMGRSVRLDIYAVDQDGKRYNIEIQRSDKGASEKRARYNSSLMDANCLKTGESVENLPETYVIFITEHDIIGEGEPIYHIERSIVGKNRLFGDGSHILYVNSECKDDTPLGKLMYDFGCTDPKDMHYPVLAERARFYKEEKEGVDIMCKAMEDMRKQERVETACRMLAKQKFSYEEIAELTDLTVDEVKALDTPKTA